MNAAPPSDGSPLDDQLAATLGSSMEEALARGDRAPVGRYRLDLTSGQWTWSDQVYVMHGFKPGQVVPTTPLMLSHRHPEDRVRVDGVLRRAAETGQPFSSVHRIIDADGKTRTVAVTGQGRRDPASGRITELFGYFIDVTKSGLDPGSWTQGWVTPQW